MIWQHWNLMSYKGNYCSEFRQKRKTHKGLANIFPYQPKRSIRILLRYPKSYALRRKLEGQ
jgi:hypothetical protein